MKKNVKKKYSVKSAKTEKLHRDKKTALRLLVSFVVLFSLYFGMLHAGFYIIQEIFIWVAFAIALLYVLLCAKIASLRENDTADKSGKLAPKVALSKNMLIILIPVIFALLIDYMMIVLGFADKFGI